MIYNAGGDVTIQSSTITGNTATGSGGGGAIYFNATSASLIINDSIVSGNTATNATGDGGAIYFYIAGDVTIRRTTLAGNMATNDGGAIALHNSGRLAIEDSTLSGNTATDDGGAIELYGSLPAYIRTVRCPADAFERERASPQGAKSGRALGAALRARHRSSIHRSFIPRAAPYRDVPSTDAVRSGVAT